VNDKLSIRSDVKDGEAAANGEEASAMPPPGVISVAALPYTDLIASGRHMCHCVVLVGLGR
jgi:hypothetical protein